MTAEEYVKHYASGQGGYESVPVDIALRAIEYAKREAKQQMMAKAVKVNISNASIVSLPVNCDLKVGDKVLIIKED